jgi:hypothetical protein
MRPWPSAVGSSAWVTIRLEVAHLADEDHVRVLPQRGPQRLAEAGRVDADLTLVDDAPLVAVDELDRVLDREDVVCAVAIDLVDHRRERRRLARAGRAGHEHEAARLHRQLGERDRQAELLERLQLFGDDAKRGPERLALKVDIDAEAGQPRHRVGRVDLPLDLELLLLLGREHAVEQLLNHVRSQRRDTLEPLELSTDADRRGRPHRQMEVGRAARDHRLEQLVDRAHRGHGGRDAAHVVRYRHGPGVT